MASTSPIKPETGSFLDNAIYYWSQPIRYLVNNDPDSKIGYNTIIKEYDSTDRLTLIALGTITNIGLLLASGAAIAATGLALGAIAPLIGSTGLTAIAAKITLFGKATLFFPIYTVPKMLFSTATQGCHFILPKIAPLANLAFVEITALTSKGTAFIASALKTCVPAGYVIPVAAFSATGGYFYKASSTARSNKDIA